MKHIFRFYKTLNLLSLDVVAGAIVCASFFGHFHQVHIRFAGFLALGFSVWLIYTCDHLLDVRLLTRQASSERHQFHQKYFKQIFAAAFVALIANGILIFFIRPAVFKWGLWLLLIVVFYLFINRYLSYLKEFLVALLYCFGVFLPTLSQLDSISIFLLRPETWAFLLLALINLLLFSWFDIEQDITDDHPSFARHFGKRVTRAAIGSLMIAFVVMLSIGWHSNALTVNLAFSTMFLCLFLLFVFPERFQQNSVYRLLGDAIFLFPLVVVLNEG